MKIREKIKKFFTSLVAISMVTTAVVPTTTMAAEMPIIPDEYTVTLSQTDGGMLTFEGTEGNSAQFEEGDEVNINITPDTGYEFSKISITYTDDGEIAAEGNDEGVVSYSFEMPSADLTVSAEWKVEEIAEEGTDGDTEESQEQISVEEEIVDSEEESEDIYQTDYVLEKYIKDNINSQYVGSVDKTAFVNYLRVVQTFFNGEFVESGDTIASIMDAVSYADESAYNKFITSISTQVGLYDVNEDSEYYVAYANTMDNTSGVSVFDYVFALNDTDGNVVNGCYYDSETGLAYIPKSMYVDDDENYYLGRVQIQLGQLVNSYADFSSLKSSFESAVSVEGSSQVNLYQMSAEVLDFETVGMAVSGLIQDDLTVFVNGIPLSSDEYQYNAATGEVKVDESSAGISNIAVVVDEDAQYGISTYSLNYPDTWDEVQYSNSTDIELPNWVTEGTALWTAEAYMYYSMSAYPSNNSWGYGYSYDYSGDGIGAWDNSDNIAMINIIRNNTGFELSVDKMILQDPSVYTLYFCFNLSRATLAYTTECYYYLVPGSSPYTTEGATPSTTHTLANVTADGQDHTGETVDFSSLGTLYAICSNISGETGAFNEGQWTALPMVVRFLKIDTDSNDQDYAIIGIAGAEMGSQCGTALYKVRIYQNSTGYLTLTKSADSSSVSTSDIQNFSGTLEGAEYAVYTDKSCKTVATDTSGNPITFKTDANGNAEEVYEVDEGIYYAQETKASPGYNLDGEIRSVEVTTDNGKDNPAVIKSVEPPSYGYIELQKNSGNTSITNGNTCYTLKGAKFGIYNSDGTLIETLTTDESGYAKSDKLALDTYTVKELERPEGYYDNGTISPSSIELSTSGATVQVSITDTPINDPMGITLYKVDEETGLPSPQGDADLSGAQFTINFYDGYYSEDDIAGMEPTRTWVLQTVLSDNGTYRAGFNTEGSLIESVSDEVYKQDGKTTLPLGTYTIQETGNPTGYLIEGDFYDYDGNLLCEAGEVFYTQLKDDGSGSGDGIWIYGGNEYTQVELVARGDIDIAKWDYELVQYDYDHADLPQGDATLEGATFEIINDSKNSVLVPKNGTEYQPGEVVMTITTEWDSSREQYVATTGRDGALPYGHYIIRETEAPTGYLNEGVIQREFDITYDGEVVDYTASDNSILNNPIRGGVEMAKWDYELVDYDYDHADLPQGDAILAGAVFEITNTSDRCVLVDGDGDGTYEHYEPGEVVMSITTEWDASYGQYVARTAADALPYGSYHIEEVSAPNGYLNEGILERDFEIREDGVLVNMLASEDAIQNIPIRGGFELQKRDAQTALAEPQGSASFDNIEFYLVNESDYCVLVDVNGNGTIDADEHFELGEIIMNFYLDDTGYYISDEYLLPYGSYRIYEVNIPGEDGYLYGSGNFKDSYPDYGDYETTHADMLADANVVVDFEIRTNDKIVNLTGVDDEYGESEVELTPTYDPTNSIYDVSDPDNENMVAPGYAVEDLVKRGDIVFRKQMGDDQSTPGGPIEWKLTSETTGETHYFWTDDNGDYSSDSTWNAHTYKTNAGEDYTDGIWFYGYATDVNGDAVAEYGTSDVGLDEDHLEAVDNSLGALPYDTYILEELPGEYNEGMELITTEVEIYRDVRVVDLGTLDNYAHGFSTKATNAENGMQYADAGQYTVIDDEIEYWGLTAGKEYTFITQLYDKTTGEMILDEDGNEMSWEQTFTPHSKDGSATVEILFDATGLDGHTLVVFEYLYDEDGNLETAEEDKDEEDQMIYFPLIGTELTANDGGHYSVAGDSITLTDTVAYEGLPTMKWITMTGVLYDKETGEPLIDADGKEVSAEKKWFNTSEDGEVEIEFTFNASLLAGDSVVASEEAYVNDVLIAHHFDWDDKDQTVSFPSVGTTMVNNWTGEHQATVFENHNIDFTDTVAYTGLDTNKQYVVIGYLMDPETQEVVVDTNGLEVTSQSEVFTPESPDGTIEVHFDFFAFGLHDTYTVAFEYLYEVDENNVGMLIAQHTDYDDAEQTVQLMKPTLWTDASITGTDSNQTDATDEVDITDMLDITGLIVGHTYYVYGKAVHEDGTPVLDATTGEPVELYNMFVADAEEMELDIMNFVFDATGLDGRAVIFEEYMYADEDRTILITEEEDLGAYEQTIFFNSVPVIGTTLVDDVTGTHEASATSSVSLTDTIAYEGLTIGETYTATGTLMNKETGEKLLDANGNEITAETTFTANTPSGTVKVEFTFDASGLSGTSAVAFEQVYSVEGKLIASHEDINDENQTVLLTNLSIGTTLLDEYTGTHTAFVSRNGKSTVRLIDTIAYDGLTVGEEYTVYGVLMNKDTGERLTDSEGNAITASDTFKAETETGYAYVVFEFDSTDLAGVSAVAYEYLYDSDDTDTAIATHTDINDEAQTVYISGPIIGTNATESSTGNKTVEAGQVSITDTVDYAGLIEGEQYTLVGYAVNPSTGEAIKDAGGNIVTNNMPFMADATAGSVDVIFPFDASNLSGETIVFVEYLYYGQSTDMDDLIAWHFDLNDEAQSIYIGYPSTQIVTTSVPTEITTTTATTSTKAPTTKQTADLRYIWILVAVGGCAAVVAVVGSKRRVKVRK